MRFLNPDQLKQVTAYAEGLNDLEDSVVSSYVSGEQLRIAGDIQFVDANGDIFTLTQDNGSGFELQLEDR